MCVHLFVGLSLYACMWHVHLPVCVFVNVYVCSLFLCVCVVIACMKYLCSCQLSVSIHTGSAQCIDYGYQARSQGHRGNSPEQWSPSKPPRKGLMLLSSHVGHVVSTVYLNVQIGEWTALHFAAEEGLAEIAGLLVKSGANVELQDKVR